MDRPKILIAEDDEMLLAMYKKKFMMEGFDVEDAHDGGDALLKLRTFIPEVIIMDVMMPIMNGTEVLKHIQTIDALKSIPVIMLTNIATQDMINESVKRGAERYLAKSTSTPNDVVQIVKGIIKERNTPTATVPTATNT